MPDDDAAQIGARHFCLADLYLLSHICLLYTSEHEELSVQIDEDMTITFPLEKAAYVRLAVII